MGKAAINLSIVLGLAIIAFAGYYLYTQNSAVGLDFDRNEQTMQNMLSKTRAFIGHRQTLSQVELEVSIFDDSRFTSLQNFSTEIKKSEIGRDNPFAEPIGGTSGQVNDVEEPAVILGF